MMTKKITDEDAFLNLSSSAQALYLHLSMAADDDGFCNQITTSMFKAHASTADLQSLLENRYIYQFENGVIVIRHWRMANILRKDRYKPTVFQELMEKLTLDDNGVYDRLPNGCQVVANVAPQYNISKVKLSKDNILDIPPYAVDLKYLKLTESEMDKLKQDFPNKDIDAYINALEEYLEMNGNKNKYKNFYLVLRKAIREEWFKVAKKRPVWLDDHLKNNKVEVNKEVETEEDEISTFFKSA